MTARFWGPGGSDGNSGVDVANRKLTRGGTFTGGFGQPGDVLNLCDGTFTPGVTGVLDFQGSGIACGGSSASQFVIQAVNDGAVTIDGAGTNRPVDFYAYDFITLKGFDACRAPLTGGTPSDSTFRIGGNGMLVQRVCAWDAGKGSLGHVGGNSDIFHVSNAGRTYNSYTTGANRGSVLEDCFGFGVARYVISNAQSDDTYTTFRRVGGRWMFSNETGPKAVFIVSYNASHTRFENCIGEMSGEGVPGSPYTIYNNGAVYDTGSANTIYDSGGGTGTFIAPNPLASQPGFIEIRGCISLVRASILDNNFTAGIWMQRIENVAIQDFVSYIDPGRSSSLIAIRIMDNANTTGPNGAGMTVTNASIMGGLQDSAGFPNVIARSWTQSNVFQSTSNVGKGASSFGANERIYNTTNGAKLLNQYQNGSLNSTPLWPWPMSARIKTATTAANGGTNTGGFTYPIIDMDADLQSIFGTYPSIVVISPTSVPGGQVNTVYTTQNLSATGGTGPYTFAVTAGSLPGGLSLSSAGVLSGTPNAAGLFNFTITATDSLSATGINSYSSLIASAPSVGGHAFFL